MSCELIRCFLLSNDSIMLACSCEMGKWEFIQLRLIRSKHFQAALKGDAIWTRNCYLIFNVIYFRSCHWSKTSVLHFCLELSIDSSSINVQQGTRFGSWLDCDEKQSHDRNVLKTNWHEVDFHSSLSLHYDVIDDLDFSFSIRLSHRSLSFTVQ